MLISSFDDPPPLALVSTVNAGHSNYYFYRTADESFTLALAPDSERMHSKAGALAESLAIYSPAIEWVFQNARGSSSAPVPPVSFLSVGLGLGYNEILIAAHALKHNRTDDFVLESRELDANLIGYFKAWLTKDVPHSCLPPDPFLQAYCDICSKVAAIFNCSSQALYDSLALALRQGRLRLEGALTPDSQFVSQHQAILFDAFSQDTSPDVWHEACLGHLLESGAAKPAAAGGQTMAAERPETYQGLQHRLPACIFVSYAARSHLKRCLAQHGFTTVKKQGFAGKRESTWAVRGEGSLTPITTG